MLLCIESVLAQNLIIFTTNDLHGRIKPFSYQNQTEVGGAARRTTIYKTEPNALILDAGDYAQGTLYFKVIPQNVNLEILEQQSYDAITLGNHEFDKGTDYIKKSAKFSKIPFLNCNIKFKDKELNELIKNYIIKEINGIKIGIIGVLDSSVKATSSANPNEYFVYDEIKSIKKQIKKIASKTDLIIILSHSGLEKDKIMAKQVEGIDLIIGGHSHTMLESPIEIEQKSGKKVLISQNGEFGATVGKWDLKVENGKIQEYQFKQIAVDPNILPDQETQNIIEKYDTQINTYAKSKAGCTTTSINATREEIQTNLTTAGALLHQAIKFYYPEIDISMNTSGGYRYGGILPKTITNKDISELFPFDSYIVLVEVKGSDIKEILETSARFLPSPSSSFLQTSGISYTINLNAPGKILNKKLDKIIKSGSRITEVKINGLPLDSNKYYKVATDNFLYFGGDGYIELKKYKNAKHTYFFLDKMLIEYLKNNSPVEVKIKDKIYYK